MTDAAEEINTGVIGADEVYGTVHGLGCDWETLMVVHVDGVSSYFPAAPVFGSLAMTGPRQQLLRIELTYSFTTRTSHLDHYPILEKRIYQFHTSYAPPENL